mmetsp:Transcript_17984/g.37299  ORF Transcript_17984/g.37299 Transcript_17984/m.37299 type:complete len:639 (+) Transcript_17984:200-2116(+)
MRQMESMRIDTMSTATSSEATSLSRSGTFGDGLGDGPRHRIIGRLKKLNFRARTSLDSVSPSEGKNESSWLRRVMDWPPTPPTLFSAASLFSFSPGESSLETDQMLQPFCRTCEELLEDVAQNRSVNLEELLAAMFWLKESLSDKGYDVLFQYLTEPPTLSALVSFLMEERSLALAKPHGDSTPTYMYHYVARCLFTKGPGSFQTVISKNERVLDQVVGILELQVLHPVSAQTYCDFLSSFDKTSLLLLMNSPRINRFLHALFAQLGHECLYQFTFKLLTANVRGLLPLSRFGIYECVSRAFCSAASEARAIYPQREAVECLRRAERCTILFGEFGRKIVFTGRVTPRSNGSEECPQHAINLALDRLDPFMAVSNMESMFNKALSADESLRYRLLANLFFLFQFLLRSFREARSSEAKAISTLAEKLAFVPFLAFLRGRVMHLAMMDDLQRHSDVASLGARQALIAFLEMISEMVLASTTSTASTSNDVALHEDAALADFNWIALVSRMLELFPAFPRSSLIHRTVSQVIVVLILNSGSYQENLAGMVDTWCHGMKSTQPLWRVHLHHEMLLASRGAPGYSTRVQATNMEALTQSAQELAAYWSKPLGGFKPIRMARAGGDEASLAFQHTEQSAEPVN